MFTSSPIFVHVRNSRWMQPAGAAAWLLLTPGLALILLALAILVWPELLAYLVAAALLAAGLVLTGWGWSLRRAARRQARQQSVVTYWTDAV